MKQLPIYRRPAGTLAVLFWAIFVLSGVVSAEDWTQWRGPNRDGKSTETGLLKEWPKEGPPLAWKIKGIGAGYSSISAVGNHIYTMGDFSDGSHVLAIERDGGKPAWSTRVGQPGGGGGYPGPRATPTVDGDLVYALGQFGDLVCVQAADGKEVWRKNMEKDFNGPIPGWGYAESVTVDGDKLVCTPGGSKGTVIALNKKTGEMVWRSTGFADGACYASLVPAEIGGKRQYVVLTMEHVAGIAAADGKVLWTAPRHGETAVISTPVVKDNFVFVTSGYGVGCNLFKITASGEEFKAEQVYANREMKNHHGGVILVGDDIFGSDDPSIFRCLDFMTGKLVWKDSGHTLGKGSMVYADGNFYFRNEGGPGTVSLVAASHDGLKEVGRFDPPDRTQLNAWPHPVVAGGKLYLRDQDTLLCYDIKAK